MIPLDNNFLTNQYKENDNLSRNNVRINFSETYNKQPDS